MLSESERKSVWDNWLGAEIRANYFAEMCGIYHARQRAATWAVLVASSGAASTLLSSWAPDWLPATLALIAAGISLYSLVAQNVKSAMECSDLHSRWNRLAISYEELWHATEAPDARQRLAALADKRADASKSGTAFPYDEKRMTRWYDLVVSHHAA